MHTLVGLVVANVILTIILVFLYATGVWRMTSFLKKCLKVSDEAQETKDQATEPSFTNDQTNVNQTNQ